MSIAATGFVLVFVLSFWIGGRAGARSQSGLMGAIAGLISFLGLLVVYVSALSIWLRAQLINFVQTEMPLILERLVELADQVRLLKESI